MAARTKAPARAGNPQVDMWARIEARAKLLAQAAEMVVEVDQLPGDSDLGRQMRALVESQIAAIKALPPLEAR